MEQLTEEEIKINERKEAIAAINPDYSQINLKELPINTVRKAISRYYLDTNSALSLHTLIGMQQGNIQSFEEMREMIGEAYDSPDFDFLREGIASTKADIDKNMADYAPAIIASYEIGQRLEAVIDRIFVYPEELSQSELIKLLESFSNIYASNGYRDMSLKLKLRVTIDTLKTKKIIPEEFSLESEQQQKSKREWEILPDFYKIDDILSPSTKKKRLVPESVIQDRQRIFGDPTLFDDELYAITVNSEIYKAHHRAVIEVAAQNSKPTTHPADVLRSEVLLPDQAIWEEYWNNHNQIYLNKLSKLTALPEETKQRFKGRKAIVTIASMNEANLAETIHSVAESYGDGFENEVTVLIYNNHKAGKPISEAARAALEQAREVSNVVIIDEEVPAYNNTGMAKKTASDLAMMLLGPDQMQTPLIMMDADVRGLTAGYIQASTEALEEQPYFAAAPEFDYDPKIKERFPVLGRIFDLRYKLTLTELERSLPGGEHMTYGMCYSIKPRTLAALGGIKPQEQYEDTRLTTDLKEFCLYMYGKDQGTNYMSGINPVAPLNLTHRHIVYVGADREIADIRRGKSPFSRWVSSSQHSKVTGDSREDDSGSNSQIPYLGDLTPENLASALNHSDPFLLKEVSIMDTMGNKIFKHFHLLYEVLESDGIEITDAVIRILDDTKDEGLTPAEYLKKYGRTGRYYIERINSLRFSGQP